MLVTLRKQAAARKLTQIESRSHERWGLGGGKERKGKERKVGDILKGAAALQRCCLLGLAGDTQGAG